MAIESGFERDPDLDPIVPPAGAAPIPTAPTSPRRRVEIEPAEPRLWQVTVPLELPVLVDGVLLDAITVHRPTGRDVADLLIEDDDEGSLNQRVRARMCRVHPDVLVGLWADDSEKVAAACRPFLPRTLAVMEAIDADDLAGEASPAAD